MYCFGGLHAHIKCSKVFFDLFMVNWIFCRFMFEITALKDANEHVGGNATFKTKVPHKDAPVEWMHNGKRIYPEKNPEKYQVISDGLNKTLVIKNLKEEEQGTLGVKVADKMVTAKLQVQGVFTTIILIGKKRVFCGAL